MHRENGKSNKEVACQLPNDLFLSARSDHLFLYVDDRQVYTNCTTLVNATLKLKSEMASNDKNRQVTFELARCVGESLRILGVTIDNKLTFSKHISDICKKTSQKGCVLTRLRATSMFCKAALR